MMIRGEKGVGCIVCGVWWDVELGLKGGKGEVR